MSEDLASVPPRAHLLKIGGIAAAVALIADQVTKWWILAVVQPPPGGIEVLPFFNLVLVGNRGVSFGLFSTDSDHGPLMFTGLAVVIVIALAVWLWRAENRLTALALGMVIGGAVGNVIDRLRFEAVVDFLDFHAFGAHWPAFNIADSAICVGAAVLVLESLFRPAKAS